MCKKQDGMCHRHAAQTHRWKTSGYPMHSSERWCLEELLSESRASCRFHSISSDSRGLHCHCFSITMSQTLKRRWLYRMILLGCFISSDPEGRSLCLSTGLEAFLIFPFLLVWLEVLQDNGSGIYVTLLNLLRDGQKGEESPLRTEISNEKNQEPWSRLLPFP